MPMVEKVAFTGSVQADGLSMAVVEQLLFTASITCKHWRWGGGGSVETAWAQQAYWRSVVATWRMKESSC
jgi:hypothetical protein